MDNRIKKNLQDLNNNLYLEESKNCIEIISKNEIMVDNDTILDKKDALRFFSERYKMQSFLKDEKLKIINKSVIENIEKLDIQDKIIISDITAKKHNYMILKSEEKDNIFSIIRGFNNLKQKKQYIDSVINHPMKYSLGVSYYVKGNLIEHY